MYIPSHKYNTFRADYKYLSVLVLELYLFIYKWHKNKYNQEVVVNYVYSEPVIPLLFNAMGDTCIRNVLLYIFYKGMEKYNYRSLVIDFSCNML